MTEPEQGEPIRVGCRALEVHDPVQQAGVSLRVLYPTLAPDREEPFGPFTLALAMDAAVEGAGLPLVLISHGTGGTPWTHRDLAAHLARSGFVAGLLQHPGNHRADDRLAGKAINLENRPRHVRLAIDAVLTDPSLGGHLRRGGVAVVGHSLGGYTALAVAGGRPWAAPWETPDGRAAPLAVERDPRVRALVLLAPATPWFMAPDGLTGVRLPILMRTGEKDAHTDPAHAAIVERGLPEPGLLQHRVIPNAGHFAFLSPYPDHLKSPAIPPSQDPEGFDRAAFLPILFDDVVTFLREALAGRPPGAVAADGPPVSRERS